MKKQYAILLTLLSAFTLYGLSLYGIPDEVQKSNGW